MSKYNFDALLNQLRYINRKRTKDDLETLFGEYKNLQAKVGGFVHDNGTQSKLLVLIGTVPILYNAVQYNIPVEIFVLESYPADAPKIYVRPTSNMTIKQNHRHVSQDGLVYLPYLHEWNFNSSLIGLVEITSSVFSIEPPLFSKPPATAGVSYSSPTSVSSIVNRNSPLHTQINYSPSVVSAVNTASYADTTAVAQPYNPTQQQYNSAKGSYTPTSATLVNNSIPIAAVATTSSSATFATPSASGYNRTGINYFNNDNNKLNSYSNINNSKNGTDSSTAAGMYNGYGTASAQQGKYNYNAISYPTTAAAATIIGGNTISYSNNMNSNNSSTTHLEQHASSLYLERQKQTKLIDQVTMRMYEAIDKQQRKLRDDLDGEFATTSYLQSSSEEISNNIEYLKATTAECTAAIQLIEQKTTELSTWESEQTSKPPVTAAQRLVPYDDLSSQIARLVGESNAIDDAFYYLERALVSSQNQSVDLQTFLKECRKLARQQFLCQAHLKKINASVAISQQQQKQFSVPVQNSFQPLLQPAAPAAALLSQKFQEFGMPIGEHIPAPHIVTLPNSGLPVNSVSEQSRYSIGH